MAGAAACASLGGVRPRFTPLPGSVRAESRYPADATIGRLDSALRERGLTVAAMSAVEGYLETTWFDASTRRVGEGPLGRHTTVVRIRFWADPEMGRTRLLAECVRRIAYDPSLPERDLERMVPEGHPGRLLLDSLVALVAPPPDTTALRRGAGPPR